MQIVDPKKGGGIPTAFFIAMNKIKKILPLVIFLIVLGLNVHLRLFPAYFPQLKKRASLNTEKLLLTRAHDFVQKQYPDYNPLIKEEIIKKIIREGKKNKAAFKAEADKEYRRLKDQYQDENQQTYLLEVDPYCRLRFTRLILENGYPGDNLVGRQAYDSFMLAPEGSPVPRYQFLYYFSAFSYKASLFIFPSLTLEKFVFYLPVFLVMVFCTVLYLFCRYFFSKLAGVFAVLFIGLSPVFINRSCAGWFDQDVFNVLWPILIVWVLVLGIRKQSFLSITKYSLLASALLGLYAFTWVGWWFIFAVIIAFFISLLFNNLCLYFRDWKMFREKSFPYLTAFFVFSAGSVIFCLAIAGTEPFSFLYQSLIKNLGLGKSLSASIWPSVLYTVSELKGGSPKDIPLYTGGWIIFMLSLLSLLWIYLKEKRGQKSELVLLLSYWIFVMFFASLKGVRFTQFLFVPLGIFLSAALVEAWQLLVLKLKKVADLKLRIIVAVSAAGAIGFIVFLPIQRGFNQANIQIPMVNDRWYDFMKQINQNTPQNSIINSWWDYGNYFKELAKRRTIVDPQAQDAPITYWMARVFLSDSEEEALRILRMVNNSSDALFDQVNTFFPDDFALVAFLDKILKSEPSKVDAIFSEYRIPKGLAKKIKEAVFFKEPAPAYLFVDSDMIYKMAAISFLGNWDFARVYILKNKKIPEAIVLDKLMKVFAMEPEAAEKLYQEVSLSKTSAGINEVVSRKWMFPLYVGKGNEEAGVVYFSNGVSLDLNRLRAKIFDPQQSVFKNLSFVFIFDGKNLTYQELDDYNSPRFTSGGFFFKGDHGWECIGVSDKALGQSLFSRLIFTKAKNSKYFEPFLSDDQEGLYLFKINWNAK